MHETEITIYTALIIAFLVVGVVIFLFVFSMIKQHKKRIELYKAKVAAEISTLEAERKRIAADLHDDLGPVLSFIKFKMADLETTSENKETLKEAESHLDSVVEKIRHISNDLIPGTLLRKGLISALEEFVDNVNGLGKMKISFHHGDMPALSDRVSLNIYRIIFEIVHNALKHANAAEMEISLQTDATHILLETTDNGKGFDVHKGGNGYGLLNILNRTEYLGGELFVESAPGQGTAYSINIPLKEKI